MKIKLKLSESQNDFLKNHPDFDLQDWFSIALNEKINEMQIDGEKISVVIAAAGRHTGIIGDDVDVPKAMLKIKGKSILERQIEVFRRFNIDDITVVRGYKKEYFNFPDINYIDNDQYDTTGIFYSFYLAADKISGNTILAYGDILFEDTVIEKLLSETSDFAVVVDRAWREHYHNRVQHTMSEAELVEVKGGSICRMGLDIPYDSAHGEFVGLALISDRGAKIINKLFSGIKDEHDNIFKMSLTELFNLLIAKGDKVKSVDILGGWFEIDTFEDYRKSWTKAK